MMTRIAKWSPLDPSQREALDGPFVILHLPVERERKTWLGKCIELGTMAIGKTEAEARKSLVALVTLQLNTLESTGERERLFHERGIVMHDKIPNGVPSPVGNDETQLFEAMSAAA